MHLFRGWAPAGILRPGAHGVPRPMGPRAVRLSPTPILADDPTPLLQRKGGQQLPPVQQQHGAGSGPARAQAPRVHTPSPDPANVEPYAAKM